MVKVLIRCTILFTLCLKNGLSIIIPQENVNPSTSYNHSISGRDYQCKAEKYRSYTGRCNNINYPEWGMKGRPFQRLLPAAYDNGYSSPRMRSVTGLPLPLPRYLSLSLFPDVPNPDSQRTAMLHGWGYFIANDINHHGTNMEPAEGSDKIKCCYQPTMHKECFPLLIPRGDIMAPPYQEGCMEYLRTKSFETHYGKREQLNLVSSFIDGSNVYGTDSETAKKLRTYERGMLATVSYDGKQYIPFEEYEDEYYTNRKFYKLRAGSIKSQFIPWQGALATLFVREHNRLAAQFEHKYPDWDDETIYQEARRFVIASIQHITYKQFLPSIFGSYYIKKFDLEDDDYHGYDGNVNPTTLNEFAGAAIRVLNSLVKSKIIKYESYGQGNNVVYFKDVFNRPQEIWLDNGLDGYLYSLLKQTAEMIDPFISVDFTQYFNKKPNQRFGLDWQAIRIQQGRDHGFSSYLQFRQYCGLRNVYKFSDLFPTIPYPAIRKLRYAYRSVRDIDLVVGGLMERREYGGIFGPTFTCIIMEQFKRLKFGDRFWYENQGQPSSFNKEQLEEISKVSLSRIICNNANYLKSVQRNVFLTESPRNMEVYCNDIENLPNPDFTCGGQTIHEFKNIRVSFED